VVLSQRERYIVIGTVAVVALFALDYLFFTPLMERKRQLDIDIPARQAELYRNDQIFSRSRNANKKWSELTAGALKRDPSTTESQFINSLGGWAQDARISLSYKPERTEKQKDFVKITYRATFNCNMSQFRSFLLRIQRATIPIRINDVTVNSRPEGSDNLQVSMGISTVYLAPEPDKSGPGSGGKPVSISTYREAY
jgi:hypothetical protein